MSPNPHTPKGHSLRSCLSAKNLIIVESPAKAKTISKFVGKDFVVKASMGHVRDLPKSRTGVDVEGTFEPTYLIPPDKKKIIKDLASKIGADTMIWIATDEDREGEAIGWHLLKALKHEEDDHVKRIVFHEITKPAILHALEAPRKLDHHLIDAQQARRVLDRLVGYELSPLLWKKVRYGLSAGRVQSVAVRLIVEREREVKAFKPEEYWSIKADYKHGGKEFSAELNKIEDKKAAIAGKAGADKILNALDGATHKVSTIEKKDVKRHPAPPFTTSTLQQEAARKLGFSVKKTMILAQQMYEGVDVFGDTMGIITYMRTDSVNLSEIALKQAQEVIAKEFGGEYGLSAPRLYKSKKGAQEAHEAIRPVDLSLHPQALKAFLDKDQHRLYEMIWMRTLACQMKEAVFEQIGADIATEKGGTLPYVFRATGQTIKFAGFMKAYTEGKDDPEEELSEMEKILPELKEGEVLDLQKLLSEQHFTKPPPRYTEASLVKKLESEGIGRPSTYAPTISTIIDRGYVKKEKRQLIPTDTAEVVTDVLVEHFPNIVDYQFTAKMEGDLDAIAEGKRAWVPVIKEFYEPFHHAIEVKQETLKKADIVNEETNEKCEKCGLPMVIKLGRYGKFMSCSNYPKCKNAKPLHSEEAASPELVELEKKLAGKKCEKCGKPMVMKKGRFGNFLGCSDYPKCKGIQSIVHFTGVKCQGCGDGQLVERRTRKGGRVFYGCNKYPKCKFATWDKPLRNCEKCGKGVVVQAKDGVEKCLDCSKP